MTESNNVIIGLLVVAILLVGYMAFAQSGEQNYYVGSTPPVKDTVTVNGEATASVAPDLGMVSFTVDTNRSSARAAQEANAQAVQEIKQALISEGIREMDIETVSFSVQPVYRSRYQCPEGGTVCPSYDRIYIQEIVGYRTVHALRVNVQQVEDTGNIADAVIEAGGDAARVNAIGFDLKDVTRDELEKQLLQQAATHAKSKAQRMADGLGVALGTVVSASESVQYPVYDYGRYDYAMAEVAAEAPPTEVFAGNMEVQANVQASFEIG